MSFQAVWKGCLRQGLVSGDLRFHNQNAGSPTHKKNLALGMKRRHSSLTREKRQPLLFCVWDPPVHGGPWAGLGESVSFRRTKELGPRSVLPDQFLTTGTPHINQGLREVRGPSDTAASCPPFALHPQACSILLFLAQEPRHSRGCSEKPGADSSTPICRPPGPTPALS